MMQFLFFFLVLYLIAGLLFAVAFALSGYKQLDPGGATASRRLRLLWMPAAVALWPLLLIKWKNSTARTRSEK
jgi:hypothetical protein